jgi:predicted phosphate transport protein (TIGR00153 family)
MFGRLMPREGKFFDYFSQHADQIVLGAEQLTALMRAVHELDERKRNIENIEHRADKITSQTMQLLHQTFITPLDRDEIHQLITRMDDILDLMEDVSQCMFLYDIRAVTDEARTLADLCLTSTQKVKEAVDLLSNLKNAKRILELCNEVDRLEGDADHVMRSAMAKLFREENDAKQLFKLKEIYQLLESVTDRCQDVANIIEGIVIENG